MLLKGFRDREAALQESMGEECIHDRQRQLQTARMFILCGEGGEEEGDGVSFETNTSQGRVQLENSINRHRSFQHL